MFKGKRTCKILKEIRAQIAAENDIEFITSECRHQGDCAGTCPKCEAEVQYLERELEKRAKLGKAVTVAGLAATITATTLFGTACQPQIPVTERTEQFLAVQLPLAPEDFIGKSDRAIYTALKTALAEAQCLEEDERYVFLVHWDQKLKSSRQSDDGVMDTYQISYHADHEAWEETYEFLHLTFSPSGTLLTAAYEKKTSEYFLSGDMIYIPEIYYPDDAQEFAKKEELLAAMEDFFRRNKVSEEDERKLTRARWNEYYTHSREDTDYYTIEQGLCLNSDGFYVHEELTRPRYLALTFSKDGSLTDAVVTEEP